MSKLKNTFGFSQSILNAIQNVYESSKKEEQIDEKLVGDQEKLDKNKNGKLDSKDFKILRSMKKEEVEPLDELTKAAKQRLNNAQEKLEKMYGKKKESEEKAKENEEHKNKSEMKEEVEELDGQDLIEAQNLVPLITQLKALLSWLVSSGAISKFRKEETEAAEMLELLEYRTKGAVGKKKKEASGAEAKEPKKSSESEEDEDMPNAYEPASRDGRHVIPELRSAAESSEGGNIQTSGGQRSVSQKLASTLHDHLMKMKPSERAEHSAHVFNGKVPAVKSLNHIKTARLIQQLGSEKKIGTGDVKRGRGRPKKVKDDAE